MVQEAERLIGEIDLCELRLQHKLSMQKAGALVARSDSYIAHIETGRMDIPKGEKLDRLLTAYGGIKQKSFFERVRGFKEKLTPRDELLELLETLEKLTPDQILSISTIACSAPHLNRT